MSPEVSLKPPREVERGLRIWGLVMGGKPRKQEARPEAREAEDRRKRDTDGSQGILGVSWIEINCETVVGKQRCGKKDRWQT